MVDKKIKIFFPYSSPNKPLLIKFVKAFDAYFPCEPWHDQMGMEGIPKDVCMKWANECDIAIILLTSFVVKHQEKFIRQIELPILLDRYKREDNLTLHSVIFEDCTVSQLPEQFQTWLYQAYWGDYPKSMKESTHKKHDPIPFENLEDSDINPFMRKLAEAVENSFTKNYEKNTQYNREVTSISGKADDSNQNLDIESQIFQMIERMQALTKILENALRSPYSKDLWTLIDVTPPTITVTPYAYIFCNKLIPVLLKYRKNYESKSEREQAKFELTKISTIFMRHFDVSENRLHSETENMQDLLGISYSQANSNRLGVLTSVDDNVLISLDEVIGCLETIKKDAFRFYDSSLS